MTTRAEVGKYLAHIRDKAGLKQNELAEKVGWSASVLSRVESGERLMSNDEFNSILKAIGTEEAMNLRETVDRTWQNLPEPPLGHPNEKLLWEAEEALQNIKELSTRQGIIGPFERRLEESKTEIVNASNLVQRTEHSIAFVGDIGVGKSTAICSAAGLEVQNEKAAALSPMLEVGGGGVTLCEVHLIQGPYYGIIVEPRSADEIHREVREFASLLKNPPEPAQEDSTAAHDSYGTSKEIERAIRNMSGLTTRKPSAGRGPDGRRIRGETVDPARELAENSTDTNAFAIEILARMDLKKRTRRELWYPDISGKEPLLWLQETFAEINNGRHPEFSIPERIEIMVPQPILDEESLSIRLVDTKGIDRTAERRDIEAHFNEPNTIVVLCSPFNSTPSPSVQQLLQRAAEGRYANLQAKTAVLGLPRYDEALAVKNDQGEAAVTIEDGYELKGEQAEMTLKGLSVPDVPVEFFNAREDVPEGVRDFLLGLVRDLRKVHCEHLSEVIDGANTQVQNFEEEQVLEVQRLAARRIMVWIQNNWQIDPSFLYLQDSLIRAVEAAHPSSLRASVRRQGEWDNLDYSTQLGFGARRMAAHAVGRQQKEFDAVTTNLLQDPELENALGLVQQARRIFDSGIESLLQKSRLLGTEIHTKDMKSDTPFWVRCDDEWGKGPGYRDRVSDHHKKWFDSSNNIHQAGEQALIEREWQQILNRISAILETDE